MNWIIISIGMAVVLALAAAVVGPVVVDWSVYRASLEAQATRALGTDVRVGGIADVRLLPSPRVRLTDVSIGPADTPLLTAEAAELDVALSPLLSRKLSILAVALERPVATVRLDADGALAHPAITSEGALASLVSASDVAIEAISLTDGTIRLHDARTGTASAISEIDLDGQMRSLLGPFTARGKAKVAGHTKEVRIAGGVYNQETGTIALSVRLTPEDDAFTLAFDGNATPSLAAPKLSGTLDITSQSANGAPIRLSGAFSLTPERASLARAPLRYGTGDAELELSTTAIYRLAGNDPLVLALETRQLDVDRIVRGLSGAAAGATGQAAQPPLPPRVSVPILINHLAPLFALFGGADGPDALAELNIGTVVMGGSVVRDLSLAIRAGTDRLSLERAEALMPGDTSADLTGSLENGFEGRLRISAAEPAALARWWSGVVGGTAASLGNDPLRLDADVLIADGTVQAPHFQLRLGGSSASGRLRYTPAGADAAATLELSLGAPFLDTVDVVSVARLLSGGTGVSLSGTDVVVDVRVERMRVGEVEGSSLNVDAQYSDGTLTVDALFAEDLAGTEFLMSGDISNIVDAPVGIISGTLTLNDGDRLGQAVRGLLPPGPRREWASAFLSRTTPGRLNFSLSGGNQNSDGDLYARLDGNLGRTDLAMEVQGAPFATSADMPLSLHLDISNDDAAEFLAQLGMPSAVSADPRLTGPVTATLDLDGPSMAQLFADLSVDGLGLSLDYEGGLSARGDEFGLNGALSASAQDVDRLGLLLGRALPLSGAASLTAELATEPNGSLAVSDLSGMVGNGAFRGAVTVDGATVTGDIALAASDMTFLSSTILGSDAWSTPTGDAAAWPTTTFGSPLVGPLTLQLNMSADTLAIGDQVAEDATFALSLSSNALTLSNLSAGMAGGTLSGMLRINRDGARADLSTRLTLADAELAAVGWSAEGTPVATGTVTASVDVNSTGVTVADLVTGLSGRGEVALSDVAVAAFNVQPLGVDGLTSEGDEPPAPEAVRDAVAAHLAAGELAVPNATAPVEIAAGTVRVQDVAVDTGAGRFSAHAAFDVPAMAMTGGIALPVASDRTDRPRYIVNFSGPLSSPSRTIDVSALSAWLNLVQLESQVQAVEEQNEELAAEAEAAEAAGAAPVGEVAEPNAVGAPPTQTPTGGTEPPPPTGNDGGGNGASGGPSEVPPPASTPVPRQAPAPTAPNPAPSASDQDARIHRDRLLEEPGVLAGHSIDVPALLREDGRRRTDLTPFEPTPADLGNVQKPLKTMKLKRSGLGRVELSTPQAL